MRLHIPVDAIICLGKSHGDPLDAHKHNVWYSYVCDYGPAGATHAVNNTNKQQVNKSKRHINNTLSNRSE